MTLVVRPGLQLQPRSRKPPYNSVELDPHDPFTEGMTDCLLFNEGAGKPINLGNPALFTTLTSSPTWKATAEGVGGYATGGSSFDIPNRGRYGLDGFSVRAVVKIISWPGDFATLVDKGSGGSRDIAVFFDTSGNVNFLDIGNGASVSVSTGMAAGGTYDFWWTRASGSSTNKFYVNGVSKGTATNGGLGVANFDLALGRNASGGGANADAVFLLFQTWVGREIGADVIADAYNNRYRGLRPKRRIYRVGAAGGGTTNLSLAATAVGVPRIVREVRLTERAGAVGTAGMSLLRVTLVTLAATAVGTARMTKQAQLAMAAAARGTGAVVKKALLNLAGQARGVPAVTRSVAMRLGAAAVGAVTVALLEISTILAAVTAAGVAAMSMIVYKIMASSAVVTPALSTSATVAERVVGRLTGQAGLGLYLKAKAGWRRRRSNWKPRSR